QSAGNCGTCGASLARQCEVCGVSGNVDYGRREIEACNRWRLPVDARVSAVVTEFEFIQQRWTKQRLQCDHAILRHRFDCDSSTRDALGLIVAALIAEEAEICRVLGVELVVDAQRG